MRAKTCTLAVLFALAAACGDRDASYETPYAFLPPVTLGDALVFVETGVPRAHVLRVRPNRVSGFRVPLGPHPILAEPRNGASNEVIVLSRGNRDEGESSALSSTLTVIPRDPARPVRTYAIGNPFNALAQSSDGRFAIAYFREDAGPDQFLFNPNEIAVVDLDSDPGDDNPRLRTVRSFGGVPLGIAFSPRLRLAGGDPRTLAIVYSRSYLTLIDLDHLERPEFTIRLTSANDLRDLFPEQILFEGNELYVRCRNTSDIYWISLRDRVDVPAGANDYEPSLNPLATNGTPSDMALFEAEDGTPRLLVVSASRNEASILHPNAGRLTSIPLEGAMDRIVRFDAPSTDAASAGPQALLLRTNVEPAILSFVDLAGIEERGTRNVESIRLESAAKSMLPLLDRGLVLFLHDGRTRGLSVLDLDKRTVAPIYAEVDLSSAVFTPDREALFVAGGSERLGFLDLARLRPGEIRLDARVTSVVAVNEPIDGRSYVAAFHQGFGGKVTFIDAAAPERGEAFTLEGLFFDDLLDEGRGIR